jgi:hypothetical protein
VTVTFSHQGELETRVDVELADAAAPSAIVAEARTKAAILSTIKLLRARRSGDLIAAAYLLPQTRKFFIGVRAESAFAAEGRRSAPDRRFAAPDRAKCLGGPVDAL